MEAWRKRVGLAALVLLVIVSAIVLGASTWAILWVRNDRAALRRVPAEITKVVKSSREAFGSSPKFGKYALDVRYTGGDGRPETTTVDMETFGFPSAGDAITLLMDPNTGHTEVSPFPELWYVLGTVYIFVGSIDAVLIGLAIWKFRKG